MTATVRKGTGRPAAIARQEKAAQRAPFPKAPNPLEAKVEALQAVLISNNWACKVSTVGAATRVVAKRAKETITIQWTAGCYDYGASSYRRADGTAVKLLNVSAAKKVAAQAVQP